MDSNIVYKKFKRQHLVYKMLFYFLKILIFIIILYFIYIIIFKISNKKTKINNITNIEINVMTKINFQINNEQNKLINIIGEKAIIGSDKVEITNILVKDAASKSIISAKKGYIDNINKNIVLQENPKITILNEY